MGRYLPSDAEFAQLVSWLAYSSTLVVATCVLQTPVNVIPTSLTKPLDTASTLIPIISHRTYHAPTYLPETMYPHTSARMR